MTPGGPAGASHSWPDGQLCDHRPPCARSRSTTPRCVPQCRPGSLSTSGASSTWRGSHPDYPTVEVRVADVCLTVDHAVAYAGLVRALQHGRRGTSPLRGMWNSAARAMSSGAPIRPMGIFARNVSSSSGRSSTDVRRAASRLTPASTTGRGRSCGRSNGRCAACTRPSTCRSGWSGVCPTKPSSAPPRDGRRRPRATHQEVHRRHPRPGRDQERRRACALPRRGRPGPGLKSGSLATCPVGQGQNRNGSSAVLAAPAEAHCWRVDVLLTGARAR